jgi:hypothetical protein
MKSDLISNNDYPRASLIYRSNSLDMQLQGGWRYYRNDNPNEDNPNINALAQNLRLNYLITSNFFFNLDQGLLAGKTNESFSQDWSDFHLIRAEGKAGGAYQIDSSTLFFGLMGGYGADVVYGAYLGTGLNVTAHEATLLAQYTNDKGISAAARYFLSQGDWGIGSRVLYNHNLKGRYQLGIGIDALIKIGELWGNTLELQPFTKAAYEMASDPALIVNVGIMLRFGGLRPAEPSFFRPYSIDPLPEAR